MHSLQQENSQDQIERQLRYYILRLSPVKVFPVLESRENLDLFIITISKYLAEKVKVESEADARRGRPDAALVRAVSWLQEIFWDDLFRYPIDPLFKRTMRFTLKIKRSSSMPHKTKDMPDPRLVAIEYEMLCTELKPILKRRPARIKIKRLPEYREATFGRERGIPFLQLEISKKTDEKYKTWKADQLKVANKELDIPWWTRERSFSFGEEELIQIEPKLTPRMAALKVIAHFTGKGEDMVWKDVNRGRKMLPPEAIAILDKGWGKRQHDPAVCQLLRCLHPLS